MIKTEKYLIENLSRRAGGTLKECNCLQNDIKFWAVSFKNEYTEKYIVFSDESKFHYIDYSSCDNKRFEEVNDENLVKVLMVDNNEAWKRYAENHGKGEFIVINYIKNQIVYFNGNNEQIVKLLNMLLNEIVRTTQNKGSMTVTWIIIAVNVIVYAISAWLSNNPIEINSAVLNLLGAKNNALIDSGQYYRLITCMFLHGGLVHIGANMYSLYCMGYMLENVYGKAKYTAIYFLSGLTASIFSYLFSSGLSIGASGAIFGLLGAAVVLGFKLRTRIGKSFLMNMVSVVILNIFISFTIPNIDIFAHLGGLIGGMIISLILGNKIWERQ
ncbi:MULTISPECIES: rhomboid family intramembrane serine protease [Clostridium]|uniref:rhomboid family intramembrane serine protease n=1 Tax=Clostridium TaxID=1485 RepID=UPI0008251B9A|nr:MULTISPECIES: rhomboid family intramembrane serine protease [Clostridium]PJI07363.1 rhomboid family intramembrane serine protease [Clostridium sp. CT7]